MAPTDDNKLREESFEPPFENNLWIDKNKRWMKEKFCYKCGWKWSLTNLWIICKFAKQIASKCYMCFMLRNKSTLVKYLNVNQ